MDLTE